MQSSTQARRQTLAQRKLTAFPDVPDFRDWAYAPALIPLKRSIARPSDLHILDQRDAAACTGFGLAADALGNGVDRMVVYTLSDALEHGDRVAGLHGKSLLHLVSRAYEEVPDTPLLGLERHARSLASPRLELVVSQGPTTARARCTARTHGEFDDDVATMNDLLHTILERPPDVPFTADTLVY